MKWEGERESDNVEDRRDEDYGGGGGFGGGRFPMGGGGGGFPVGGRGLGIGTVAVIVLVAWGVFGINPLQTIGALMGGGGVVAPSRTAPYNAPQAAPRAPTSPQAQHAPANDPQKAFVSTVLASTEDVWTQVFAEQNKQYPSPRLVLYRGATPTACGTGQAAMGPFYCPGDRKVYLDLDFFDTLSRQLGAPGQFAQAYVVAHEVGHHVQNLLGLTAKVDALRGRGSATQQNQASVRLELQADCFAGIWANRSNQAKHWLEQGDIESALNAASKIGDDALQKRAKGFAVPDSFTHGSSAQRVRWFTQGYKGGKVSDCDTFGAQAL